MSDFSPFSSFYALCVQIRATSKRGRPPQVQPQDQSPKAFVKPLPRILNFPADFWLVDLQLLSDLRLRPKHQKAPFSKWLEAKHQNKTQNKGAGNSLTLTHSSPRPSLGKYFASPSALAVKLADGWPPTEVQNCQLKSSECITSHGFGRWLLLKRSLTRP